MHLPRINNNSPSLRKIPTPNRLLSSSTTSSSSASSKSKESDPFPILVQLCLDSDEDYACNTMRLLLSSRYRYSPNVYDEFGCNVLMYALRYQRYRLFEYLLKNISTELNFQAKDRQGNTILHYAIIYSGKNTQIIEKLIEIYKKFAIQIDERNQFGFTPLLLAAFCGRYDFVWTLLTKTDASPFVRDHIHLKNMFDYLDTEGKHQQSFYANTDNRRLISQLHQTLPVRERTYGYKNFFETFLSRAIRDRTDFFRPLIIEVFHSDYQTNLFTYLNQRYPRIQSPRRVKDLPTARFPLQRENSKLDVHNLLTLFDPTLKPKAELSPRDFSHRRKHPYHTNEPTEKSPRCLPLEKLSPERNDHRLAQLV